MCLKLRLRSSASAEGELPLARSLKKVHSSLNVEEEYNKALHTKSFVDIWKKAHQQLKRTTSTTTTTSTSTSSGSSASPRGEVEEEGDQGCSSNMTSPLSLSYYSHLPDFILDPCQETLISATSKDGRLRDLLIEFFDTTLEACNACTSLLACIDSTRTHHGSLRRLLHQARDTSTFSANLAAHLNLDNPLSATNLACFHRAHALFGHLILRLATAHRRILKRARIIRLTKKATGYSVVAVCGAAAAVVVVVVAVHSVVGLAFMPVAVVNVACGVHNHERVAAPHSFAGKLLAAVRKRVGSKYLEKAGATVDAAAKGAYIVGRDLDTVSRMVARLHGEVEHGRDVVRMVMRNKEPELVKEVAREMESGEEGFGEQLAELEEHVYLCLLTINRSRRMVAEAMGGGGGGGGVAPPAPMA